MRQRRISVAEPCLDGNEAKYVNQCIEETWISSRGEFVDRFEAALAQQCGVRHAVVTSNGTTALHLALLAHGVSQDDEVIMPSLTYVATANATKYCNAHPVFIDSEANYFAVDSEKLEAAITSRTKAIITVPLYGHPVDMDPIRAIAAKHGISVIEDSAEAIGATYKGKPVGSLADCSTFSFFGNKLITTGEGGAVVTDNEELANRMRFLRGQAVSPDQNYWHTEVGYNYRMTNVAAAIGVAQMERIDSHIAKRRVVAEIYDRTLGSFALIEKPQVAPWATHSYWMYTILLAENAGIDRDLFMQRLKDSGIETRPVFYPVHTLPPYQQYPADCPVASDLAARGVNLPTHGNLSGEDVEYVCEQVKLVAKSLIGSRGQAASSRAA